MNEGRDYQVCPEKNNKNCFEVCDVIPNANKAQVKKLKIEVFPRTCVFKVV